MTWGYDRTAVAVHDAGLSRDRSRTVLSVLDLMPPPWSVDALCARVDPDLWFPEKGGSTRNAKQVCRECPVTAACLEYGMTDQFGVYGGRSAVERRRPRPISDRTAFTGKHTGSSFTVKWHQVLDLLEREYWMLNGRHLVIEVDVPERAIRNDGLLRSDAKSASPAVRVAFESKHGPITMATDRFVRQSYRSTSMDDWQHNVYAIAKALEALRMVDRYGVSRSGEQYRGYKAIGGGTGLETSGMTTRIALAILKRESGVDDDLSATSMRVLRDAVRFARAAAHPDRNNGDRSRYDAVDQAVQVLERQGLLT